VYLRSVVVCAQLGHKISGVACRIYCERLWDNLQCGKRQKANKRQCEQDDKRGRPTAAGGRRLCQILRALTAEKVPSDYQSQGDMPSPRSHVSMIQIDYSGVVLPQFVSILYSRLRHGCAFPPIPFVP
jgi:hypothetical protein